MARQYLEDDIAALRGAVEEVKPLFESLQQSVDLMVELLREMRSPQLVQSRTTAPVEEPEVEDEAEDTVEEPAPVKKRVAKKKVAKKAEPKPAAPTLADLKKRVLEMIGMGGGEDLTAFRKEHEIHALGSLSDDDPALVKLASFLDDWFAVNAGQ